MQKNIGPSNCACSKSVRRTSIRPVLAALLIAAFPPPVQADASASYPVAAPASTAEAPARPASTQASAAADSFAAGSRYWSVTAGTSHHHSIARVYGLQLDVSQYIADNLAVDYGGSFGYLDAERTSGGAFVGPELGMRWHVARDQRWSAYLESVVGAIFQQHPLTQQSLRFNFDLQPGYGATYQLSKNVIAQGGVRWYHLSNARLRGRAHNFGYDGPMLYLKLMQSF